MNDVRWQQRFRNFEKVFLLLQNAVQISDLNELERCGLLWRFNFSIELAWKTMKDFLEDKGFDFKPSPKDTIRLAQESAYINYAQELIDGLDLRNILSHDYSGKKFAECETALRQDVFPALEKLYNFFLTQKKS